MVENNAYSTAFWRSQSTTKWAICKECGWDGLEEDPNEHCMPILLYNKCERCNKKDNQTPICSCGLVYIAHNVCNKCDYMWHGPPGPSTSHCPNPRGCDSFYWTWMNYPIDKPNWCEICKVVF